MGKNKHYSAVILAAGHSQRMGEPKLFLKWKGKTFAEHIIDSFLNFGCNSIVCVINKDCEKDFLSLNLSSSAIKYIINPFPSYGRFYSLKLGLKAVQSQQPCFVSPSDNPIIDCTMLSAMSKVIQKKTYVIPVHEHQKGHPILLSTKVIHDINTTEGLNEHLKLFLRKYPAILCQTNCSSIGININTPQELADFIVQYH